MSDHDEETMRKDTEWMLLRSADRADRVDPAPTPSGEWEMEREKVYAPSHAGAFVPSEAEPAQPAHHEHCSATGDNSKCCGAPAGTQADQERLARFKRDLAEAGNVEPSPATGTAREWPQDVRNVTLDPQILDEARKYWQTTSRSEGHLPEWLAYFAEQIAKSYHAAQSAADASRPSQGSLQYAEYVVNHYSKSHKDVLCLARDFDRRLTACRDRRELDAAHVYFRDGIAECRLGDLVIYTAIIGDDGDNELIRNFCAALNERIAQVVPPSDRELENFRKYETELNNWSERTQKAEAERDQLRAERRENENLRSQLDDADAENGRVLAERDELQRKNTALWGELSGWQKHRVELEAERDEALRKLDLWMDAAHDGGAALIARVAAAERQVAELRERQKNERKFAAQVKRDLLLKLGHAVNCFDRNCQDCNEVAKGLAQAKKES